MVLWNCGGSMVLWNCGGSKVLWNCDIRIVDYNVSYHRMALNKFCLNCHTNSHILNTF